MNSGGVSSSQWHWFQKPEEIIGNSVPPKAAIEDDKSLVPMSSARQSKRSILGLLPLLVYYFITEEFIKEVFTQSKRFFNYPMSKKMKLLRNKKYRGYTPFLDELLCELGEPIPDWNHVDTQFLDSISAAAVTPRLSLSVSATTRFKMIMIIVIHEILMIIVIQGCSIFVAVGLVCYDLCCLENSQLQDFPTSSCQGGDNIF